MEDVYYLSLEGREFTTDYTRIANNWKAYVVRIGVHPYTWRHHEDETLALCGCTSTQDMKNPNSRGGHGRSIGWKRSNLS